MDNIIKLISKSIINNRYIQIPDNILFSFSEEEIEFIVNSFGGKYMIMLPQTEIAFFEWLKNNDIAIWNDIWNECDDENCEHNHEHCDCDNETCGHNPEEPYTVSVSLLPYILDTDGRGFPICDLIKNDNYYFHINNMVDEESKIIIDVAKKLFKKNQQLTIAQLLALEISIAPIDIWHFAYKYNINLADAKRAVQILVEDNALVHIKQAEFLLPFIPF